MLNSDFSLFICYNLGLQALREVEGARHCSKEWLHNHILFLKSEGQVQNSSPQMPVVSISSGTDEQDVPFQPALLSHLVCQTLAVTCMQTIPNSLVRMNSRALCPIGSPGACLLISASPTSPASPRTLIYCLPPVAHNQIL